MIMKEEILDIQILDTKLNPQNCIQFATDPSCGGLAVFIGTVRDATKGRAVQGLEFEAYTPMAISEMKKIAATIVDKWSARKVSMHHFVGPLEITGIAVIIAVSTPHRKAAFEACQYAIDTLKDTVPIWKKEIFEDGEVWVSATP